MQAKVLAEFERIIAVDHEAVQRGVWANTGHVYAMDGFATVLELDYAFQDDYCTLKFAGVRVGEAIGAGLLEDSPPVYRVRPELDEWDFPYLRYNDGTRIQHMFDLLSRVLEGVHSVPATS